MKQGVKVQDQLIRINHQELLGLNLNEVKSLVTSSRDSIQMVFKRALNSKNESEADGYKAILNSAFISRCDELLEYGIKFISYSDKQCDIIKCPQCNQGVDFVSCQVCFYITCIYDVDAMIPISFYVAWNELIHVYMQSLSRRVQAIF